MEKRVVVFMVLSAAIMVAYVALQATFGPKPDPAVVAENIDKAEAKKAANTQGEDKKSPLPEDEKPQPETPATETTETPAEKNTDLAATKAQAAWATLGSVDPNSPYRMLVTLNSKGGAIERIEMASPRYRDLDDRSGYLGHLALSTTKGSKGAKVNVVGAGTPAAVAGMQPGDVIEGFNGEPIHGPADLNAELVKTKAGSEASIAIVRGEEKKTLNVELIRRPLEVIRPEIEGGEGPDPTIKLHPLSGLLTLAGPRNAGSTSWKVPTDPLRTQHWELKSVEHNKQPAVEASFRLSEKQAADMGLSGAVEVVRRYTLATVTAEQQDDETAPAYHLDCEVEIRNLSDKPLEAAIVLDGPNGLPLEGWWYTNKISTGWGGAGARDLVWRTNGTGDRRFLTCSEIYKHAKNNEDKPAISLLGGEEATRLDYIGVDAQYFSAIWIPDANSEKGSPFRTAIAMAAAGVDGIEKVDYKRTNVTFRMTSELKNIPAEGSYKQTMRMFAGPKVPGLLMAYTPGGLPMDDVLYYGWFRWVSIPLAWLLHFLKNNLLFNYGLAIVALTVIVRGCMVPFSLKAAKNAKMMQDLQPELKAIAEKYKNDLPKRSEAQSALFKKYNYSPLSGCLPMFMQLPIFLGLYRALATDIELRQAPLIPGIQWASNLAGPDMLWYWKDYLPTFLSGEASGWLGPYFNILPLVSVAFLLVHQKLFTPPATDEQTKMTQDMMKYMTVFMGVMFFKVPAGLCIYFITSSLWSVCERLWLPKTNLKPATVLAADGAALPAASSNGVKESREARAKKLKQKKK